MRKLPKPSFRSLLASYRTSHRSVHDCARVFEREPAADSDAATSAVRLSEALVLALELVDSRPAIANLRREGSRGDGLLLGRFGFRNVLCPHGLALGSRDLAFFLKEHWGFPSHRWRYEGRHAHLEEPDPSGERDFGEEMDTLRQQRGILFFLDIEHLQGHVDLWNGEACVGGARWEHCRRAWFWSLG